MQGFILNAKLKDFVKWPSHAGCALYLAGSIANGSFRVRFVIVGKGSSMEFLATSREQSSKGL